ncbi:MAG: TlpA disulfide reductase family protein [Bacteroidota bacterium]
MRITISALLVLSFAVLNSCNQQLKKNYPYYLSEEEIADLNPIDSIGALHLESLSGDSIRIGKNSTKNTVLVFFATWCGSCKVAIPKIDAAFDKNENLNVIAVGREHSKEELLSWADDKYIKMDVVADENGETYSKFADQYIPRIYVIDKEGKVLFQGYGWDNYMLDYIERAVRN